MKTHEVQQGESILDVATQHEVSSWRWLYNHPANAELRALRPDPFTLQPGDVVHIPAREWLQRSCATGKVHVFGHKPPAPPMALVHLRFDIGDRRDYIRKRYALHVDGVTYEGETGSDAQLHQRVPIESTRGELEIWIAGDDAEPQRWALDLSHLDSSETPTGAKGRLYNLGMLDAEPGTELDGEIDEPTRAAILGFADEGSEDLDPKTLAALDRRARPEFEGGEEYLEVGKSYRLQLVPRTRRVHLRFANADARAYAGRPYVLELDGELHEGTIGPDAGLELELPITASEAELRIALEGLDAPEIWALDLDELGEHDSVDALEEDREPDPDTLFEAALINLGFLAPEAAGDAAKLERATAIFQAVHGLEPTGEADGITRRRLAELTG